MHWGIVSAMECAPYISLQVRVCCRKFHEPWVTQDTACGQGHMLPGQPLAKHTLHKGSPLLPDVGLFSKQFPCQSSPLGWARLPQCCDTGWNSFYPVLLSSPFPLAAVGPAAQSLALPAPSSLYPHRHHPQWISCTSNSVCGFCFSEATTNTALNCKSLGWEGVVCSSSLVVPVGGGTEMLVRAAGQEWLRTGRLKGTQNITPGHSWMKLTWPIKDSWL